MDDIVTLMHGSDPVRVELTRLENEVRDANSTKVRRFAGEQLQGNAFSRMTGKRKFDGSTYELGDSSRSLRSLRLSQPTSSIICDAVPGFSYFNNGDCEYICQHCGALFWFAERIMRTPNREKTGK